MAFSKKLYLFLFMSLSQKFLLIGIIAIFIVPLVIGVTMYNRLKKQRLKIIAEGIDRELGHIEFALQTFFEDRKSDLKNLIINPSVRDRNDKDFTNFLDADEKTFTYKYGPTEKNIIKIFNDLRITHPFINSVYMGRENGSFVRSHPRARPTRYDPRDRPWYIAAKEKPGEIVVTYPYQSVTTPDINIGFVTTLLDSQNVIYGVVGMDVTLLNMTDYIAECKVGRDGRIILAKDDGLIVAFRDKGILFKFIDTLLGEAASSFIALDRGKIFYRFGGENYFIFYRSNPCLGLKIGMIIPEKQIENEIKSEIIPTILEIFAFMGIVALILLVGLRQFVLKPLRKLTDKTTEISLTSDLTKRVDIRTKDEFGVLASSFNIMLQNLYETRMILEKTDMDLRAHKDNLEHLVKIRTFELEESRKEAIKSMEEAVYQKKLVEEASKKLEESYNKLSELEHIRDDLTNMIIHDMRNLLTALSMSLGLLASDDLAGDTKNFVYKTIETSTNEMMNMVETLLDITRLEQGKMPVNLTKCELLELSNEVALMMRPIAEFSKVELIVYGEPTSALCDRELIKRVLINLTSNAIKFNPPNQKVEIIIEKIDNMVIIKVRDRGPGIPEQHFDLIFEKFTHLGPAEKRKTRSVGLGLTFCKMAIEAQGGKIGVDSKLGEGSIFWFTLPAIN